MRIIDQVLKRYLNETVRLYLGSNEPETFFVKEVRVETGDALVFVDPDGNKHRVYLGTDIKIVGGDKR